MVSIYTLLAEFPSAKAISKAHLTRLSNLLQTASKGRYNKETAITFRDALFNATIYVCHWDPTFNAYLAKTC